MKKERRMLARRRELEIRDVGGLAVEMARRDRFRPELLFERANDVVRLEERMLEIDGLLMAAAGAPRGELRFAQTCRCGAPLPPNAHFCSHCGRPSAAAPPVLTCTHCGQPLPADTNFCASCGNRVANEQPPGQPNRDETVVPRWSSGEDS
jgi:Double zinc ribbon